MEKICGTAPTGGPRKRNAITVTLNGNKLELRITINKIRPQFTTRKTITRNVNYILS
jgi:hypothetical protein